MKGVQLEVTVSTHLYPKEVKALYDHLNGQHLYDFNTEESVVAAFKLRKSLERSLEQIRKDEDANSPV